MQLKLLPQCTTSERCYFVYLLFIKNMVRFLFPSNNMTMIFVFILITICKLMSYMTLF